jgi:hypothetical protein
MDSKVIWSLVAATAFGYFLGKNNSTTTSGGSSFYPSGTYIRDQTYLEQEKEELERKIEDARFNLENAVNSAEEVEHQARMRWLMTNGTEDMMRLNDAEDATMSARDALNSLDD